MELSEQKIREYSIRLMKSRLRLLCTNGFYGLLLMHMVLTIDEECETAATDGVRIYFGPDFLENLTDSQIDIVMMHEILHVALQHCSRSGDFEPERFNIACDIVVNSLILESMGGNRKDSPSQVKRYIRLTKLIPELLDKVDEGKIALTPAVELSYLRVDEQKNLLETMNSEDCTPSLSQAQQLRNLSLAELLTMDQIFAVMSKSKANQKEKITIKLDDIRKFIPKDYTQKQVSELLIALLEKWSKQQNKTRNDKGAR